MLYLIQQDKEILPSSRFSEGCDIIDAGTVFFFLNILVNEPRKAIAHPLHVCLHLVPKPAKLAVFSIRNYIYVHTNIR